VECRESVLMGAIMSEPELDSMDLASQRREYMEGALRRSDLHKDPVEQFQIWIREAQDAGEVDATAMTLSTQNDRGGVSTRVVLL